MTAGVNNLVYTRAGPRGDSKQSIRQIHFLFSYISQLLSVMEIGSFACAYMCLMFAYISVPENLSPSIQLTTPLGPLQIFSKMTRKTCGVGVF